MKKLFIIILFLCLKTLQAQYIYEFEKLDVTVIKDFREIEKLKQEADFFDSNLFFIKNYQKDNFIFSILVYRKDNDWVIYETPFGGDSMFPHFVGYSENGRYAFFQVKSHHSTRGADTNSSNFYIIDLINNTFTYFETDYYQHLWWYSEEDDTSFESYYSTKSQIIIEGNKLIVLESDFSIWEEEREKDELDEKFGWYDSQNGIYEIQEQKLLKTHYYDNDTKRMKPIIYVGDIALGMVLRDVAGIYNYGIELKEVSQFTYGYDSEETGYELWISNKPLYFLIVPNRYSEIRRIEYLTILSPEISVHGLNTDMTVKNVLKKYPDAKLNIDLINDWEYIYIKNLNLRLEFKTNKDNRIAQYKLNEKDKSGDFVATKLLNENQKIDFITIVK